MPTTTNRESWPRTLMAGAVGGLLGSAAMWVAQEAMRSHLRHWGHVSGEPDAGIGFQAAFREGGPAATTARIVLPDSVHARMSTRANALLVHGAFGVGSGAFYAAARREFAFLPRTLGSPFGVALWIAAAEIGLPALSLSRWPHRATATVQVFGLGAHLLFAATVEGACRALESAE